MVKLLVAWTAVLFLAAVAANSYFQPGDTQHTQSRPSSDASSGSAGLQVEPSAEPSVTQTERPQRLPFLRKGAGHVEPAAPAPVVAGGGGGLAEAPPADDLEDNAPRPPPRPSDSDFASPLREPLPGAGPERLHGDLSAAVTGELAKPIPMPGSMSQEEKREAHRGQCFNAVKSDSLPLDRKQPERRSAACRALHDARYPGLRLGTASVVIVFHNEIASTLVRSVHSVLNHSPPNLLVEIILVDDASTTDPTRFSDERLRRLKEPLEAHIQQLPKVRIARLGERRGLMLARMEGAWRATGEVVVFLDSHIEATPGWLEPMLARIAEDRRQVVVPSIDTIDFDSFVFEGNSGLGVLGFTWTLGQRPESLPQGDPTKPVKSPIMAGGLFAAHRGFFMHLGGYDDGMKFYGGEEMEIGFRTWQCGGEIEFVSCSHVFHVFRNAVFWQGTDSGGVAYKVPGYEITRNKLRAAAVWMDEYARLVEYASPPLPSDMSLGDLSKRMELRKKLKCRPFSWYLKHVTPKMFAPDVTNMNAGALRSRGVDGCIDTMGGNNPGLYPCHGQHGTQGLVMDGDGIVRVPLMMYEHCLTLQEMHGKPHERTLVLRPCPRRKHSDREDLRWTLDAASGTFSVVIGSEKWCVEALNTPTPKSPVDLHVVRCAADPPKEQLWEWQKW